MATSNTQITQDKTIKDLEEKFARASKWCDCIEQEMDQFYLYAEYIGENWSSRKTSEFDLGRVVYDLTKCVRNTIFSLDPLNKCGTDIDYNEPAWLSEKRAKRSLAIVKEKSKDEDVDGYGKRLLKQAELLKKFALPDTEDEHTSDSENEYGHSEEEFLDEEAVASQ